MLTYRSGPIPVRPSVNLLSRRDCVLSLPIGTAASRAAPTFAAPQTRDMPTFESGRYQFTIVRPQQELPSIRLFRLEGAPLSFRPFAAKSSEFLGVVVHSLSDRTGDAGKAIQKRLARKPACRCCFRG